MGDIYLLHHLPKSSGPDFNEASALVRENPHVLYHDGACRMGESLILVETDDNGAKELSGALPGWRVRKASLQFRR